MPKKHITREITCPMCRKVRTKKLKPIPTKKRKYNQWSNIYMKKNHMSYRLCKKCLKNKR